jgi:hypothetical protein
MIFPGARGVLLVQSERHAPGKIISGQIQKDGHFLKEIL